jgi:hypothetical protein
MTDEKLKRTWGWVLGPALLPSLALAHGGGLNAEGCHHNRKTGDYHCHRSYYVPPSHGGAPLSPAPPAAAARTPSAPGFYQSPDVPAMPRSLPAPRTFGRPGPSAPPALSEYQQRERKKNEARADYWKQRGYRFDPSVMSAYAMDQKVKDRERSKYWADRGHHFNADYMSAYAMDRKVNDIERSKYWAQHGYHFNADYLSAYAMDQKVRDIERARYWAQRGLNFNSDVMSAYSMDMEARRRGVAP